MNGSKKHATTSAQTSTRARQRGSRTSRPSAAGASVSSVKPSFQSE
jgi:hypothetical protein